jgi:nuclear receptor subfamily 2 group E protein 3
LEESWSEIFLLCALQWSLSMEVNPLLSVADYSSDKSDIRAISELIMKFKMLNVDAAEFAFLKAIVLFKSELRGLKEPHTIENLQDQAQLMLSQHTSASQHTNASNRFGKMLLVLPMFKNIGSARVVKLYFSQTIGNNLSIEKILTDLIKS